jgi:hypothetical protein
MQESGNATVIARHAGCNVILEASLEMLETTRLIETVARGSLIEVGQYGVLTSPGGAASLCPHYFEDVVDTQEIMREDRCASTLRGERHLGCIKPAGGTVRMLKPLIE